MRLPVSPAPKFPAAVLVPFPSPVYLGRSPGLLPETPGLPSGRSPVNLGRSLLLPPAPVYPGRSPVLLPVPVYPGRSPVMLPVPVYPGCSPVLLPVPVYTGRSPDPLPVPVYPGRAPPLPPVPVYPGRSPAPPAVPPGRPAGFSPAKRGRWPVFPSPLTGRSGILSPA